MERRDFLLGSGFAVFAALGEARAANAMPAQRWTQRQDELARGLASGAVSQLQWHDAVNALAGEVDLEALAAALRRARLRDAGAPFGHDPRKRYVRFLDENGAPMKVGYGAALFDFGADSVITPHAHKHMASAHLVLEGKVRIRTFDRVADEEDALLIRPTGDAVAGPGHAAAMTSAVDNIHWFVPRTPKAMTLDVIVDGLDAGRERYTIQPVDPLGGKRLAGGTIRAPLLSFAQSSKLYDATR